MKPFEVQEAIRRISYKPGWRIIHGQDSSGRYYLQVEATTLDVEPILTEHPLLGVDCYHKAVTWKGGKKYLSPHMCRQDVVGACFDLFKAAEEHELREWFQYKSTRIYSPRIDPDWLAEHATGDTYSVRVNAMTTEETA